MLTEDNIREALRACFDPELRLNVVDLGLVQAIDLAHDADAPGIGIPGVPARQRLRLTLLAASHDESYRAQLQAVVSNRLAGIAEISRSEVVIASDPPWSPARMTAAARGKLKVDRGAKPLFPILNNRIR